MNKSSLILFIIILIAGCGSDKKEITIDTENKVSIADSLKQQFLPIIGGSWVGRNYLALLEENKSPMKSFEKADGIFSVIIPFEAEKDTAWVNIDYNNHEADGFTVYFKPGTQKASLATNYKMYDRETDFFELSYAVTNRDTILFINRFNASKKLVKSMAFKRVSRETATDYSGYPVEVAVNKLLFEGEYTYTDSLNQTGKVVFKDDGTVTGFGKFVKYYVNTDYTVYDPEELPATDFIYLHKANSDNAGTIYDYSITGNTLFLWHDDVKYKLIKE